MMQVLKENTQNISLQPAGLPSIQNYNPVDHLCIGHPAQLVLTDYQPYAFLRASLGGG